MLRSATEHYRRQQAITTAGLLEARRASTRGPAQVAKVVTAYQIAAARESMNALPLMLAEQGIPDVPEGAVAISGLAGQASDGRPLETLFAQSRSSGQLALMVATQLQDVARVAAGIGITSRPNVTGYARMLNPPSCSRCAILAGKFFKWNAGFQRHPRCDCRHIPSTEAMSGDLTTDPSAYFDSLTEAEQNKAFTNAGAQAIRDGADPIKVVNVRSGMSSAGVTRTTTNAQGFTVNATRRTLSGDRLPTRASRDTGATEAPALLDGITFAGRAAPNRGRLTPEGIYGVAGDDRTEAIRLLRSNGYLL